MKDSFFKTVSGQGASNRRYIYFRQMEFLLKVANPASTINTVDDFQEQEEQNGGQYKQRDEDDLYPRGPQTLVDSPKAATLSATPAVSTLTTDITWKNNLQKAILTKSQLQRDLGL